MCVTGTSLTHCFPSVGLFYWLHPYLDPESTFMWMWNDIHVQWDAKLYGGLFYFKVSISIVMTYESKIILHIWVSSVTYIGRITKQILIL